MDFAGAISERARERLAAIVLAEELKNVSRACRQVGMDRTSFYEWRRRFRQFGLEGLEDRPPIPRHHPATTPDPVRERVVALALENPGLGCAPLAAMLAAAGHPLSSVTVQTILNRAGLGTRPERLALLERRAILEGVALAPESLALIEGMNPAFRERHAPPTGPGERVCLSVTRLGEFGTIGPVFAATMVDTCGSYALVRLSAERAPLAAVRLITELALPLYRNHQIALREVMTDLGPMFQGGAQHAFGRCVAFHGIAHTTAGTGRIAANGMLRRFLRTLCVGFCRAESRRSVSDLAVLQRRLDAWLHRYNHEQPWEGFPNFGASPAAIWRRQGER
jgi:transposase-like protein